MLIITLCINYISFSLTTHDCSALSRGAFTLPRVQCVRFVFAIVNACAGSQTRVLASIFCIPLLIPYVLFLMVQGWWWRWRWWWRVGGGTAAVQVFEGTPLQFNVRS